MKSVIIRHLRNVARTQLARFRPKVIAVTGSVGKTSTKNAIAIALAAKYGVRTAEKNYNNEIGVPLAILGEKSPGRNVWEWMKLFRNASNATSFPEFLVLEYGADKPGDIAELCALAQPKVGVITSISPVHAANYPNFAALAEEKATLGDHVPEDGLVVLNGDDPTVNLMRDRFAAPTIRYGMSSPDIHATDLRVETRLDESFDPGETFAVTRATIVTRKGSAELELRDLVGEAPVLACLAAVAVAEYFDIPVEKSVKALNENLVPTPGRFRPIAGIKGSLVIDDTYNAAPASVLSALETLKLFTPARGTKRRIVVLGKMAELGQYSEGEHRHVGRKVAEVADLFVAVGSEMRDAAEEAEQAGLSKERIQWMTNALEAGRYLDRNVEKGDVVLVKGSQSARMEIAVKDIMAEPLRASNLLCRQEEKWLESAQA